MRPHLSLDVRNVPASVEFYQKVFGVSPQKHAASGRGERTFLRTTARGR